VKTAREFADDLLDAAPDFSAFYELASARDADHAADLAQSRAECAALQRAIETLRAKNESHLKLIGTLASSEAKNQAMHLIAAAYNSGTRDERDRIAAGTAELREKLKSLEKDFASSRDECETLRAQLDRAVALVKKGPYPHVFLCAHATIGGDEPACGKCWPCRRDTFLASLAAPSQPEPVKAHRRVKSCGHVAYRDHEFDCIEDGCENAAYQIVVPAVPENAGATCAACSYCKGEGGKPACFKCKAVAK
jgi:hypothetical protein